MKKILFYAFLIMNCALLLAGCGEEIKNKTSQKVGALTQLNTSPEQANLDFYDNFNSLQMALTSKNVDSIQIYGSVAKYMTNNNPDFVIKEEQTINLVDDFCFAMREDDIDLKNACDNAINAMKADGTLDALIDKYINNLTETPQPVESAHFDGADTIKVGITGDLPLFDLVLADGTPAGFNTAVLSELGKRLGKNIELVQVESSSRAAALVSGQVDIIFWVAVPADNSGRSKDFDKPEGISVSEPYYRDSIVEVNFMDVAAGF
ncbi:MAG: transporter substrate-binding domain-containing protein [Selenomonadaceae bacterium]|nr:transporter substrate-binding domain-containing protein [Selenomonadaceae bacterium]